MADSVLQRELGKKKPFDLPEQEAALNLQRTCDCINARFVRFFKSFGLTGQQYNVLRILRGVGGDGIPSQTIGEQMITVDPDVTRLVDRLLKAGLVERNRSEADRRVVKVTITKAGLQLLKKIDGPLLDMHRKAMGHMSKRELTELNRLLVKARQGPT